MVDAFGEDSKNWIDKMLTVITKDSLVSGGKYGHVLHPRGLYARKR